MEHGKCKGQILGLHHSPVNLAKKWPNIKQSNRVGKPALSFYTVCGALTFQMFGLPRFKSYGENECVLRHQHTSPPIKNTR